MKYEATSFGTTCSMGVTCDKSKDRVIINVGGMKHECYISTIQNFPDTRLYWIAETALKMADFDPEGNEFFFDRHPGCFQNILNYCRTGKLHCPNDVCGPLFEQELAFWGVEELMMEPCCWAGYIKHREANENLKMFDLMRDSDIEGELDDDDEDEEERQKKKKEMGTLRTKINHIRHITWDVLERPFSSKTAQICAMISMLVIILSIATFCLETMEQFYPQREIFEYLEYLYCAFFTLEFLIRLACCPSLIKFFKSFMTWIDIVSTAQFYISFFSSTNSLEFLFVSRMIRVFRLFRFFKRLSGMQVIAQTLKASANELFLLVLIVFIPMVIFSTLMYYAERGLDDDFPNIPESFWWAVITMTTVGYGDKYPKSNYGKIIGTMCACSGVLIVALPVSVIGSNFSLYYSYAQARMKLPKRKSPALVTADKALVSNHDHTAGSVKGSLECLTSMMVDLAVPPLLSTRNGSVRERRHAIKPSINPTRRKNKGNKKTVGSALSSFANLSLGVSGQHSPLSECRDENRKNTPKPSKDKAPKRNKSMPLLFLSPKPLKQTVENEQEQCVSDDDSDLKILSRSSEDPQTYDNVMGDENGRTRRVLHVNLGQYVPRKLSTAEQIARRKLSQQNFREKILAQSVSKQHEELPIKNPKTSMRNSDPLATWTNREEESSSPVNINLSNRSEKESNKGDLFDDKSTLNSPLLQS